MSRNKFWHTPELNGHGNCSLLTYSMQHSPSWEADQSSQLVKKFPAILWNPKVLYRTHKCPPPVPILSQLHPVPTTPSNFLKIPLNIIILSMSGSPQWPLSLRFPHQYPVHPSLLPHTRHMFLPSHSSRFNHPLHLEMSANSSSNKLSFQPTVFNYEIQTEMHIMKRRGFVTKNSYLQCLA
jgi:hypothetical protein